MDFSVERPHKRRRLWSSGFAEIIKLLVNKTEVPFAVHKEILCISPVFSVACKSEGTKPEEKVIKLPEDDSLMIKVMLHWMYCNEICIPENTSDVLSLAGSFGLLLKVFLIADRYQLSELMNDAIDALIKVWDKPMKEVGRISSKVINHAYEHTLRNSPLRKLLVLMVILEHDWETFPRAEKEEKFCSDFKTDMTVNFYKAREGMGHLKHPKRNACQFHTHKKNIKCYKLKPFVTHGDEAEADDEDKAENGGEENNEEENKEDDGEENGEDDKEEIEEEGEE